MVKNNQKLEYIDWKSNLRKLFYQRTGLNRTITQEILNEKDNDWYQRYLENLSPEEAFSEEMGIGGTGNEF